jgi:hypothetical protein
VGPHRTTIEPNRSPASSAFGRKAQLVAPQNRRGNFPAKFAAEVNESRPGSALVLDTNRTVSTQVALLPIMTG